MASAKKTRKQLLNEPDEFITFSSKIMRFAVEHRNMLTGTAIAFFVVIALTVGIQYYLTQSDRKSLALLETNLRQYEEVLRKDGTEAAHKSVEGAFTMLLDKYSSRTGGKFGQIVYGDICYYAGQPEKAVSHYEKALKDFHDDPALTAIIANSLGYAQDKAGNREKAIEHFESIVLSPGTVVMKGNARYNLGRLYEMAGERDKSLEMYKKLLEESPNFVFNDMVRERIAAAEGNHGS